MTDAEIERIADAVPIDTIDVHITTWHRRFARAVLAAQPAPVPDQPQAEPDIDVLRRVAKELLYYNPLADEYKGKHVHKYWSKAITDAIAAAPVPRKMDIPPAPVDMMDVVYAEGWNDACDAFFGGLPPAPAVVITVSESAAPVPVPLTGHVYLVQWKQDGTQCIEAFADRSAAVAYAYLIGSHAYVACVAVRTPEYVKHVFGIAASPEVPTTQGEKP
jgi:hypothetical protein